MLRLKACPKCNGDLIINQERHYSSEHCLQCGYERELLRLIRNISATGATPKAGAVAVEYGNSKETRNGFSHNHSSSRFIDRQKNSMEGKLMEARVDEQDCY